MSDDVWKLPSHLQQKMDAYYLAIQQQRAKDTYYHAMGNGLQPKPPAKSSAIASLKASLALNIKDKPILGYDAAVYHQVAAEEADREYWHKLTGGESDNWHECPTEGKV